MRGGGRRIPQGRIPPRTLALADVRTYHRRVQRAAGRRSWLRAALIAGIVAPLALAQPTLAEARTVADFWQVSVQMPPQLWDDGGSLPFMMGTGVDEFSAGGTTYRIQWNNAAIRQDPAYLLRQQGGRTGVVTAGLYDHALTPAQLRKYGLKQRLLWLDADVLVADAASPVCAGLTKEQVDGVLTGSITDWRSVFPTWPAGIDPAVGLRVPTDREGKPRWGFGRQRYAPTSVATTDGGSLGVTGGQVAVQKLSYAERYLASAGLCAVPVDGVTPSAETTRSLAYPHAYGVHYVSRTNPTTGIGAKPAALIRRWESLLFGAMGDEYLTTASGRARYLP